MQVLSEKYIWIIAITAAIAGCVTAPEPGIANLQNPLFQPQLISPCIAGEKYQCRPGPIQIRLMRRGGSVVSRTIAIPLPFVANQYVTVYAGERLFLEAQIHGDQLQPLQVVPFIANPSRTLILKLYQPAYVNTGIYRGPGGMMLTVFNPFNLPLTYKAAIMPADKTQAESTSSCAVMPGKSNYQSWKDPIILVWLTDFHLVRNPKMVPCH
jgi:hypothetical protein